MPPPDERTESICLWFVSFLLFMFTASGGTLLVLVLILPEDNLTRWFPEIGLLLVGTPWIFWFFMAVYRCLFGGGGGGDGATGKGSPAGGKEIAGDEVGAGSQKEKISNGNPTMQVEEVEGEGSDAGKPAFAMAMEVTAAGDGLADGVLNVDSSESVGKESSIAESSMSHESEVPLALAMSS